MYLQLAEKRNCLKTEKRSRIRNTSYLHFPKDSIYVKENYFDNVPLKEYAEKLCDNGYTLSEISELAKGRQVRRTSSASQPATRKAFRTEKKVQKIEKRKAKTEIKKARAEKKRDTGTARKVKAEARLTKQKMKYSFKPEEEISNIFAPEEQQEEETPYYETEEIQNEEEQYFQPEEEEPEGMEETKKQVLKKRISSSLVAGLKRAGTEFTKQGKKPATSIKLPAPAPAPKKKSNFFTDTLFKLGTYEVSGSGALLGGALITATGLALSKKRRTNK